MALRRSRDTERSGSASTLVILGLANPGPEYEGSRHNVGGDAVRLVVERRGARLKLLQQLQERWEGFGEGAKAVLQGRLDPALGGQRVSPVTRGLDVKPEFGRAVEALLGAAVEAINVVPRAMSSAAGRPLPQTSPTPRRILPSSICWQSIFAKQTVWQDARSAGTAI